MGNFEFSIIKSFKTSSSLTASERLNRLSFEAKILTYIGFHDNVVSCYGISMINSNPSLVLSYESNMTLHDYLKQNQVLNLLGVSNQSLLAKADWVFLFLPCSLCKTLNNYTTAAIQTCSTSSGCSLKWCCYAILLLRCVFAWTFIPVNGSTLSFRKASRI